MTAAPASRRPAPAPAPLPSAAGARAARTISTFLFRSGYRRRVHGREHVPATGGVLLASNHAGIIDGPMLIGCCPRPVHSLIKAEMFHGFVGAALVRLGQIALHRDGGDRAAITASLDVLRSGRVLAIFPEGTRGAGTVATVERGAAYLALRSGVPVVPVACLGTRPPGGDGFPRLRAHVDVVFGEPFSLGAPGATAGRAAVDTAAATLQRRLAAHVVAAAALTGQPVPADETADETATGTAVGTASGPADETGVS